MHELFAGLITSKTRIKLLIRFFINPDAHSYLRELAKEFDVSSNAVREELNQLKATNLLKSEKRGRMVYYRANTKHPLFPELKSMVNKVVGVDRVIDGFVKRLGHVEKAYIIDDYAEGKDSGIIDLLLVGEINQNQLINLTHKTEQYIQRKIRTLVITSAELNEFKTKIKNRPLLLIWHG